MNLTGYNATLTAIASTEQFGSAYLNLTFSHQTFLPSFQIFTHSREISYEVQSPAAISTWFIIQPLQGIINQNVTLIFTDPQGLFDGQLELSSYVLSTSILTTDTRVRMWLMWAFCLITLVSCFYGRAGLMLLEYVQITFITNNSEVFFKNFRAQLLEIMLFRWGTPFSSLPTGCFLNNTIFLLVIWTLLIVAALVVRRCAGQGQGRFPKIKYMFNYNMLIVVWLMTILPLSFSIVQDIRGLSTWHRQLTPILVINHILCFLCLISILVIVFQFYRLINRKFDDPNPNYYRCFAKLFSQLHTKRWYRRNERLWVMLKSLIVATNTLWFTCIFYVDMLQGFELFLVWTWRPYKSRLYNNFKTVMCISILVQYTVISIELMFQYMSPTLLEFDGSLKMDIVQIVLFIINSAAFLILSIYEAVVRLRTFFKKQNVGEKEVEMTQMTKRDGLLDKTSEFDNQSPRKAR